SATNGTIHFLLIHPPLVPQGLDLTFYALEAYHGWRPGQSPRTQKTPRAVRPRGAARGWTRGGRCLSRRFLGRGCGRSVLLLPQDLLAHGLRDRRRRQRGSWLAETPIGDAVDIEMGPLDEHGIVGMRGCHLDLDPGGAWLDAFAAAPGVVDTVVVHVAGTATAVTGALTACAVCGVGDFLVV